MKLKAKIQSLLIDLNKNIYEKNEVIALALLASLAGESIFLLGSVGIAKSLVARRLKYVFKDSTSFEYLMSRFSTPDEIFGNISVSKLKSEDKYERITKGYLPSATDVFLDEIWKASPSIQNALLTAVNERVYRNGDTEIRLPMRSLISASNELPAKGEGLEALWDRFLIRYVVVGIQDQTNFRNLLSNNIDMFVDPVGKANKFTNSDYKAIQEGTTEVIIPENILSVIEAIRNSLDGYNNINTQSQIHVSDRRWKKIARILKASAFLNDRDSVDLIDCFLIVHCIWDSPDQINTCFKIVSSAILSNGYSLSFSRMGTIRDSVQWLKDQLTPEQAPQPAPEPAQQNNPVGPTSSQGPAIYANDQPMMMQGYFVVLGLELLIAYDDYHNLEATNFTPVVLWELNSRSEYNKAGDYSIRKVGPCRIEFETPPLRGKSATLLMKTIGDPPPPSSQQQTNQNQQSTPQQPLPLPAAKKPVNKKQCAGAIQNIRNAIYEQKSQIISDKEAQVASATTNLFVDDTMNVVINCLNNAQIELEKLELEIGLLERQLQALK